MGSQLTAYMAFGVPVGNQDEIFFQGFDEGDYLGPEGEYPALEWMTPTDEVFIETADLAEQMEARLRVLGRWVGLEFIHGGVREYESAFLAGMVLKSANGSGFQKVDFPGQNVTYNALCRVLDALKALELTPKLGCEAGWYLIPAYN